MRIIETRVLRRIHGTNSQIWRKVQNVYRSPNITGVLKPRRVKRVSHVACVGETRGETEFKMGNLKEEEITTDRL
jgi:hypothetical protein